MPANRIRSVSEAAASPLGKSAAKLRSFFLGCNRPKEIKNVKFNKSLPLILMLTSVVERDKKSPDEVKKGAILCNVLFFFLFLSLLLRFQSIKNLQILND